MSVDQDSKETPKGEQSPENGTDQFTIEEITGGVIALGRDSRAIKAEQYIEKNIEIIVDTENFEDQPPAPGEAPYKGLPYYQESDKDKYFGREELSRRILLRLRQPRTRFLALIGASGIGKSSLLRAGVVPLLRDRNWEIRIITPGGKPLSALAHSLSPDSGDSAALDSLIDDLAVDSATLAREGDRLAAALQTDRLLLAVDQFEEIFSAAHDEQERQAFFDNLVHAANDPGPTTVLINIRSDFYDRLDKYDALAGLVSQQQEFLTPMQDDDLIRVILEPAKLGGWKFVKGLVEQLLEDVGREPGRLPLLSHALRETWNRRSGVVLTLGGYRKAGGVEGAIAKTADSTLAFLAGTNPKYENITRDIFLALTELGDGEQDTRRAATHEELAAGKNKQELNEVLEVLIDARLITAGKDGKIEVAHDALIRRWSTLRDQWLVDNRQRLRFERRLQFDARQWEKYGRDDDLYRGDKLKQAQLSRRGISADQEGIIDAFLAESASVQRRELLRQYAGYGIAALALFIFLIIYSLVSTSNNARLSAEVTRVYEAEQTADANLVVANSNEARATRLLVTAQAANATSTYNEGLAVEAKGTADAERVEALKQSRRALAHSLMTNSRALVSGHFSSKDLAQARLLALEARRINNQIGSPAEQTTNEAMLHTLAYERTVPYQPLYELTGLAHNISSVAWNRDGSLLAIGGCANGEGVCLHDRLIIWDVPNEQPLQTLSGHDTRVTSVAWNHDSSNLASASSDGKVIVWDAATWQPQKTVSGHRIPGLSAATRVAWSDDGRMLAIASCLTRNTDGCSQAHIAILDTLNWQQLESLGGYNSMITSIDWNSDSSRLASVAESNEVIFWDTATLEEIPNAFSAVDDINAVAFGDAASVFAITMEGTIWIFDTEERAPVTMLTDHISPVISLAWSADGKRLASSSSNGAIIIWDTENWKQLISLTEHSAPVQHLAWNEDGTHLASADAVGSVIIWDTAGWQPQDTLDRHVIGVDSVDWNDDGSLLATSNFKHDSDAIWYAESRDPLAHLELDRSVVNRVAWNKDGTLVANVSLRKISVWDSANWRLQEELTGFEDETISDLAWSNGGNWLASASCAKRVGFDCTLGEIILWDTAEWQPLHKFHEHTNQVTSVAWNPDDSLLASTSLDKTVILWDTKTWQPIRILQDFASDVQSVAWNEDGSRLAAASQKMITIWDTADWRQPFRYLYDHNGMVNDLDWSEDGRHLASASSDETVIVWDTRSWRPLATLDHHMSGVNTVSWTKNGRRLASGADDHWVFISNFPDYARLHCRLAGRNLNLAEWQQYLPDEEYRCTCHEWPAGTNAPPEAPGCAQQLGN